MAKKKQGRSTKTSRKKNSDAKKIWKKHGYASNFEHDFALNLKLRNIEAKYEEDKVPYFVKKTYNPDFKLVTKRGKTIYIETKGYFTPQDRSKHLKVKAQNPELDIRFVFMNPFNRLSRTSKTTYAQWCDKHGFKWAYGILPDDWMKE